MPKCALYRHFDSAGNLLYVGISVNPMNRTGNHNCNADWFEEVVRIDIEWHPTRDAALWFEDMAIGREDPKYNLQRPSVKVGEKARRGIRARRPEIQKQIDNLVHEAKQLGHKLDHRRCLMAIEQQVSLIKEGKDYSFV